MTGYTIDEIREWIDYNVGRVTKACAEYWADNPVAVITFPSFAAEVDMNGLLAELRARMPNAVVNREGRGVRVEGSSRIAVEVPK